MRVMIHHCRGCGRTVPARAGVDAGRTAAIACGTGTAYSALKRLDVSGRDTLAIFGQGPVGLAATQRPEHFGGSVLTPQQAHARVVQRFEAADAFTELGDGLPIGADVVLLLAAVAGALHDIRGVQEDGAIAFEAVRLTARDGVACG